MGSLERCKTPIWDVPENSSVPEYQNHDHSCFVCCRYRAEIRTNARCKVYTDEEYGVRPPDLPSLCACSCRHFVVKGFKSSRSLPRLLKIRCTRGTSATKGSKARAFTIHPVHISTLQDVSGPNYDIMVHYAGAKTSATSRETVNKRLQTTRASSRYDSDSQHRLQFVLMSTPLQG